MQTNDRSKHEKPKRFSQIRILHLLIGLPIVATVLLAAVGTDVVSPDDRQDIQQVFTEQRLQILEAERIKNSEELTDNLKNKIAEIEERNEAARVAEQARQAEEQRIAEQAAAEQAELERRQEQQRQQAAAAAQQSMPAALSPSSYSPPPPPVNNGSVWDALAQCESNGNWHINTGNGFYGGIQFMLSTWLNMGGGQYAYYPHEATREQQIEVATRLQAQYGWGQWPACSAKLGLR